MTAFSGRRYGTFSDRAAAERYLSTIKDPEKRAKTRAGLGLDEQAPETAMQALQRIAGQSTPPQPAPEPWHQRNPNGTPTIPRDALSYVSWDLCKEGQKDEGLVPAIQLSLPYPPSVNSYWKPSIIPLRKGAKSIKDFRPTVYVSKEGKAFRAAVKRAIWAYGNPKAPIGARLSVKVEIHPPDKRLRDIDNITKSLLDALTHAGFWADDVLIDELLLCRRNPVESGKVIVTIKPLMEGRLL